MGAVEVNHHVLKWARDERRLSEEEAAKRLGISVDQLASLESGDHKPTISELRKIAQKYQITFAALLMPEPLPVVTRPNVKDFRTHGGLGADYDHQMMVEIEDINQQLSLLADLKADAPEIFGLRPLASATINDDPTAIAKRERDSFAVPVARQLGWDKERHAFLALRDLVETRGIFVYARNLGPLKNCRGFSILDERDLPAIVINSNNEEEYGPRIFTLMHEYAHLLLREAGISDENRQNRYERFCNQFAADFLMPRAEFRREARTIRSDGKWTDRDVGILAKRFKVSKSAVAIHLETTQLAQAGFFDALKEQWKGLHKKPSQGISTYPEKVVNRYGVRHVEVVMRALDQRKINELDVHEMLEIRSQFFESVRKEAHERHEVYGGGR